jgi:hypothetical protein
MFGSQVEQRWRDTLTAVAQIGGDIELVQIDPPASENEIKSVENALGFRLPAAFRNTLLTFSRKASFGWFLPDDYELPHLFREIFCGNCHWSLDVLVDLNEAKNGWITEVFPDPADPYDQVWHEKFAFYGVGNGDYLSIDLKDGGNEEIVYLSHDDGEGHGRRIAPDFEELILRWSRLGCVGGEDWQWAPFVGESDGYLDPDCENAREFRKLLQLDI